MCAGGLPLIHLLGKTNKTTTSREFGAGCVNLSTSVVVEIRVRHIRILSEYARVVQVKTDTENKKQ